VREDNASPGQEFPSNKGLSRRNTGGTPRAKEFLGFNYDSTKQLLARSNNEHIHSL